MANANVVLCEASVGIFLPLCNDPLRLQVSLEAEDVRPALRWEALRVLDLSGNSITRCWVGRIQWEFCRW